jgi:hypothetical protein
VISVEPTKQASQTARQKWDQLTASEVNKSRLVDEIKRAAGPSWHICWQDNRLTMRRLKASAAGVSAVDKAIRNSKSRPLTKPPCVICDGERIVVPDREPAEDDLIGELAYVIARICERLGWKRIKGDGGERFRRQLERYTSLYEADFYSWALETARKLRQKTPAGLDWENLAEEVEDLARRHEAALKSQMAPLHLHLLKWRYSRPEQRSGHENSWRRSVKSARREILRTLKDKPGLKPKRHELFATLMRRQSTAS